MPMLDLIAREDQAAPGVAVDERLARVELRRQIGRLERELGGLVSEAFGRIEIEHRLRPVASEPRVLDLGGLEQVRDELADRVAQARRDLSERAVVETRNRELLHEVVTAPAEHKWVKISRHDVGEPGCGGWHSVPRLGPLGMLMGWWRVKVSSGCPLAGRLAAVERQAGREEARQGTGGGEAGPIDARRAEAGRAAAGASRRRS